MGMHKHTHTDTHRCKKGGLARKGPNSRFSAVLLLIAISPEILFLYESFRTHATSRHKFPLASYVQISKKCLRFSFVSLQATSRCVAVETIISAWIELDSKGPLSPKTSGNLIYSASKSKLPFNKISNVE